MGTYWFMFTRFIMALSQTLGVIVGIMLGFVLLLVILKVLVKILRILGIVAK